ncbi:hypothetical protein ABZX92_36910 [Lentzea sp. NPDC006480]
MPLIWPKFSLLSGERVDIFDPADIGSAGSPEEQRAWVMKFYVLDEKR